MTNTEPFFSPHSHSINVGIATETKSINAALVFNHIFFWIVQNKAKGLNEFEGRTWMYETFPHIAAHYPYLSEQQVRDAINLLIKHGYLLKGNFSENKFDRTNWYALANEEWAGFQKSFAKRSPDQMGSGPQTRCSGSSDQMIYKDKILKEDTKENKSEHPFGRVASSFYEKLKKENPKLKKPNLDTWAKEFQRLSKDGNGNTIEEIEKVIDYVLSTRDKPSTNGFCWANNILSPGSLRKHFAKIWAEMNHGSPKVANQEDIVMNKKLAEYVEQKLRQKFGMSVYMQATPDYMLLYHRDKDIQRHISYAAFDPIKFKEILLKEAEICFPTVREIFKGLSVRNERTSC